MAVDILLLIPTIVAPLISAVCCLWLLIRSLPRVSEKYSRKLLLRQMWHLALADIWMSIGGVPLNAAQARHIHDDDVCKILQDIIYPGINGWGLFASVLVEMHIALGFAAGLFRWGRFFRCLERSLPCVWAFGLALSVLDTLTSKVFFDEAVGACQSQFATPIAVMRPVQAAAVILTSVVSSVCYFTFVCCSGLAAGPASVEVRVWRQCSSFMLVFLLTWGPWLFSGYFLKASWAFNDAGTWAYVSGTCLGLNGALNCITYAGLSRYVRQMRPRGASSARPHPVQAAMGGDSFHVKFAGEDVETFWTESLDDHPVYFQNRSQDDLLQQSSADDRASGAQGHPMPDQPL